ncbi:malto-oligosyltrehalose trehalohydrolase [Xaviernesmea oryzae]|uniref:Malto-oligosyltrehalose trehalohydrolase n=1 Tax=Xaviernesmea oryzae TaxID=464029 RepID=A0A1Q9AZS3_9HYPH|nr:malto-oligosyltrehalose trehalohydrolase [Xaviernesmea oryzae]OLP61223.1 malto-oligosyltrehalose trehalohydrolase [Xaviernesmea oryzae]SEL50919.1 maltooligosyltrehalose trehalohydrolase [Xaviernesmea oryzae]
MTEKTFGPLLRPDGVLFRLWAPLQDTISLEIDGGEARTMSRAEDGWHSLLVAEAGIGTRYQFVLADGLKIPDPGSRHQPEDVHGPSEVVDLGSYDWKAAEWSGRPIEEIVLYELHIGTFTAEGTFRAAIDKLDHLKATGITAIQIMPIADFPGRYNWGYDGVLPYAPDASYGRPEDLMALVDAAHERGLCVFLDVVYNHFGPDGNYLPAYAPIFTDRHKTPWGNGINYDGKSAQAVRAFVIENAIDWIETYRFDGLRLDAVHAIEDNSGEHLLHELARRVRAAAGERHVHLVVENEDNDSDLLMRDAEGRPVFFTAQWNDDIHHVLHIAATGETFGYYADYADDKTKIGRALAEGFVFQGEHMPYRGEERGKPSADLPPTAFISFIQNHDQIGNRAKGDRMAETQDPDALKAITAIYLLAPQVPMLFMGEEWGATEPFPYFCDFNEELNEAVRKGRREELSRLPGFDGDDLMDPTAESTFKTGKLDWSKAESAQGGETLSFYKSLLDLRRRHIAPLLAGAAGGSGQFDAQSPWVDVRWTLADGSQLRLLANLSAEALKGEVANIEGERLLTLGAVDETGFGPWSLAWMLRQA